MAAAFAGAEEHPGGDQMRGHRLCQAAARVGNPKAFRSSEGRVCCCTTGRLHVMVVRYLAVGRLDGILCFVPSL